jgi:hypothetical protein
LKSYSKEVKGKSCASLLPFAFYLFTSRTALAV